MAGRLAVITGPMFSGKSTELLRRVKRAQRAGIRVVVLKPAVDTRSPTVRSHDGTEIGALAIPDSDGRRLDIVPLVGDAQLIAIDEGQFLNDRGLGHVPEILSLVKEGRHVVVAGLDLTYAGEPFGPMPWLLSYADEVVKLSAVCVRCGKDATRTQRIAKGEPAPPGPVVQIGSTELYEPRCLDCWVSPYRLHRLAGV